LPSKKRSKEARGKSLITVLKKNKGKLKEKTAAKAFQKTKKKKKKRHYIQYRVSQFHNG
jgi:hypothetical protein